MMRERTLRHLMLIVGRTLQSLPDNFGIKDNIHEVCETLDVTRERRGPYLVTWTVGGVRKSIELETERFRFHERGDVPERVEKRQHLVDGRTHNWNEARDVWREMLPLSTIVFSSQLAPHRRFNTVADYFRNDRFTIIAATLLVLMSAVVGQSFLLWAACALMLPLTKPNIAKLSLGAVLVLGISVSVDDPLIAVCLFLLVIGSQVEQIFESEKIQPFANLGSSVLLLVEPKVAIALLIVVIIELVTGLISRSRSRAITGLAVVALAFLTIYLSGIENLRFEKLTSIVVLLGLIVAVTALPRSIEKSMIRISAPLAVICLCAQQLMSIRESVVVLTVWQVLMLQKPKYTKTDISSGTPVAIRSRSISEQL
jgi:hypothetical protein